MAVWKLDGKKVKCPSCYEELTTGQYQRIIAEWEPEKDIADRDFYKVFGILTGANVDAIARTNENQVSIENAVGWLATQPFKFSVAPPAFVRVSGKIIDIPKSMGDVGIGQMIHLRRRMEEAKFVDECISFAVAVAVQPIFDGKHFNITRAKELEKEILKMPIYLTHPVGFFLLQKAASFGKKRTNVLRRILNSLSRILKRMWQRWLKSEG